MTTAAVDAASAHAQWPARRATKCRLCTMAIKLEDGDDVHNGLCSGCKGTPEAKELLASLPRTGAAVTVMAPARIATATPIAGVMPHSRDFNAADLGLIRSVGAYMPPLQLLAILNDRLVADLGTQVARYSLEQLHAAITRVHGEAAVAPGRDWPSLRRILARARRDGVLSAIDDQVISDFAVAFQLTTKQTLELKDIVLPAGQES